MNALKDKVVDSVKQFVAKTESNETVQKLKAKVLSVFHKEK